MLVQIVQSKVQEVVQHYLQQIYQPDTGLAADKLLGACCAIQIIQVLQLAQLLSPSHFSHCPGPPNTQACTQARAWLPRSGCAHSGCRRTPADLHKRASHLYLSLRNLESLKEIYSGDLALKDA